MDGIHEGETDGAILARMGTDAAAWAREMHDRLMASEEVYLDPEPGALLHVWLANAIEAGRAAGYSQGRRDAEEGVRWMADHLESDGDPVRRDVAADMRERLTGWPLVPVGEPDLPADLAGRSQPEDPAARDLPADLAGRDIDTYENAKARFEQAWREHAGQITTGPTLAEREAAPPGTRYGQPSGDPSSPIARAADALEQIAETLRVSLNGPRPLMVRVDGPTRRQK